MLSRRDAGIIAMSLGFSSAYLSIMACGAVVTLSVFWDGLHNLRGFIGAVALATFVLASIAKALLFRMWRRDRRTGLLGIPALGLACVLGVSGIAVASFPDEVALWLGVQGPHARLSVHGFGAWAVSVAFLTTLTLHLVLCTSLARRAKSGSLMLMSVLGYPGGLVMLAVTIACSWPWLGPTFVWATVTLKYWGPLGLLPLLAFDLVLVSKPGLLAERIPADQANSAPITNA